jgi:hypothetical protein
MDKIEELKNKFFKQLMEDNNTKLQDYMNYFSYLMSVAFNNGFDKGYEKGYQTSLVDYDDGLNAKDIPQSDNVE